MERVSKKEMKALAFIEGSKVESWKSKIDFGKGCGRVAALIGMGKLRNTLMGWQGHDGKHTNLLKRKYRTD